MLFTSACSFLSFFKIMRKQNCNVRRNALFERKKQFSACINQHTHQVNMQIILECRNAILLYSQVIANMSTTLTTCQTECSLYWRFVLECVDTTTSLNMTLWLENTRIKAIVKRKKVLVHYVQCWCVLDVWWQFCHRLSVNGYFVQSLIPMLTSVMTVLTLSMLAEVFVTHICTATF